MNFEITIDQVDDPIDPFDAFIPLDDLSVNDSTYFSLYDEEDNNAMFYRSDGDSLYLKFSQNISDTSLSYLSENIFIQENDEYIYDLFIPEQQLYYFAWQRSADIDTDLELNMNPEQIYYRLEFYDDTNYYVIEDAILDSNHVCDDNYCNIETTLRDNNNYKTYLKTESYNPEEEYDSVVLDVTGETEYNWRVVAENYSDNITDVQPYVSTQNEDEFYIDLDYPIGEFYFTLNQIYYDYYNMYFIYNDILENDDISSFADNILINYYDSDDNVIDESLSLNQMVSENNIFYSNGTFNQFNNYFPIMTYIR